MRHLIILLGLALCATSSFAADQTPLQQARALEKQARASYKAGNFVDSARDFGAALALRPHHPALLYNFAATSAKTGNKDAALRALGEYADMGLIARAEKDDDFTSLRDLPAFKAIVDKIHANGRPTGESKIIARLTEGFLAEGIAYDDAGKRFFLSSVDQRKIVQITADGMVSDFVPTARDGLLGAFGMAIDTKNEVLWVASSAVAHARNLRPRERGTSGVFGFSLRDGKSVSSVTQKPPAGRDTVIGDLTVDNDGTVYATDSIIAQIYAYTGQDPNRGSKSILWMYNENFASLQGLTQTPDGALLIVADYATGLHFVDPRTKTIVITIDYAGGTTLLGIDGLARSGNTLLAVQNGIAPTRILALTLDGSGHGIAAVNVISANDPNIPEPSLGTVKGGDFCVVANAQWSRFNDDGTRKQDLDPPHIACISLKSAQK